MRRPPHRLPALVAVAALALTTGCNPDDVPVPDNTVDVDTPALVEAKRDAGVEDCTPVTGAHVDGGLPELTLPCLGGGPDVELSSLRGPMLVSLWAYWCQKCRAEMPILQAFYDEHGDRVPILGVDYLDTQPGGALALMKDTGATYPSVADPYADLSAKAPLPVIKGLPFLLFVTSDGVVSFIHVGDVESEKELLDLVDQHLGVRL